MVNYSESDVPLRRQRQGGLRGYNDHSPFNFAVPSSRVSEPVEKRACKHWFLEFSSGFCARLPRELRNQVYEYLVPYPGRWSPRREHSFAPASLGDHIQYLCFPLSVPYYLQPYFVDTQMTREMDEFLCEKVLTNEAFKTWGAESLKEVLNCGYPLGTCLPYKHIRALHVVVRPPYWDFETFPRQISAEYDKILSKDISALESLLGITHRRGFALKITAYFKAECSWPIHKRNTKFIRWVEAMVPLLHRFDMEGFEVELVRAATMSRSPATGIDVPYAHHWSILVDSTFKTAPEQWLDSVRDTSIFVGKPLLLGWTSATDRVQDLQESRQSRLFQGRLETAFDERCKTPGITRYEQVLAQPRGESWRDCRGLHTEYCEQCMPRWLRKTEAGELGDEVGESS